MKHSNSRFHLLVRLIAVIAVTLSGASVSLAQQPRYPITIENVYYGFPAAPSLKQTMLSDALFKHGSWTPVYVALKCNFDYKGSALLVTEASDSDDVPVRYAVAIPRIPVGQVEVVTGYARPGGRMPSLAVHVLRAQEENGLVPSNATLADSVSSQTVGMDPAQFLFLSVGSRLDGNRLPGMPVAIDDERNPTNIRADQARTLLANITAIQQMPINWFGYQGVDTVILTTGDRAFMDALVSERDGRKTALAEWVRRGGRIIVSVGKNGDQLAGAGEISDMLPIKPTGTSEVEINRVTWTDGSATDEPLGMMTIGKCTPKPDRPLKVLAHGPKTADGAEQPLVMSSSFAFGRVTVVAFDVDDRAITKWKGREIFWRELMNRSGNKLGTDSIGIGVNQFGGRFQPGIMDTTEDNQLTELIGSMEKFPDVPVISFGWVALFILIYIIIVGPLDYWFLKKVVKRLEFTWITFPTIVLVVSAAAYYAAYALKGSSLRTNKHDVVDIDLTSKQMMGRSWFTIFSPRIQNYQIGLEPTSPDWTAGNDLDVIVGWCGQSRYNSRQSLFRRSYDVRPKATGLENVPIQVWSTKGFQGQWSANLEQPLIASDLRRAPDGKGLIGSVTANLPDVLENAVLIERQNLREPTVRVLGSLLPGAVKTVSAQETRQFSQWVDSPFEFGNLANGNVPKWYPVKLFFHDMLQGQHGQIGNASLRDLDMSWRLNGSSGDVAIIVGTLPPQDGDAQDIMNKSTTPSRLWLGAFPGTGVPRPKLDGNLHQETCVRIIVPIQPALAPQPQP